MTNNTYTEDLSQFGTRELEEAKNLLVAMFDNGLPSDFYNDGVKIGFNKNSGYVFLTNSDYQVAIYEETERGKYLASFYTSPYNGIEGTFEDLLDEFQDMHPEDQEWFQDIAKNLDREDELPELEESNNA